MIKNVIFDIGNVLIEYRWLYPLECFGLSDFESLRVKKEMVEDDTWKKFDLGELSLEEASLEFQRRFPQDKDVIDYFMKHTEELPVGRTDVWAKMAELKEAGYGIYLLSNYPKELYEQHVIGSSDFLKYVDGGVISYEEDLGKPDAAIYELLLSRYDLKAEECIFFDDRIENVEGSKAVGIDAVQITSRAKVLEEIEKLLNLKK